MSLCYDFDSKVGDGSSAAVYVKRAVQTITKLEELIQISLK